MTYPVVLSNVPRPGARQFLADWPVGGLDISVGISQDGPVTVTGPATTWKTFDRPGGQGQGLCAPMPNQFLKSSGSALFFDIPAPGAPLLTARTFTRSGAVSVEAIVAYYGGAGYAGPVIFNGEGNYVAVYLVPDGGGNCLVALYTPYWSSGIVLPLVVALWTPVALRVDVVGDTALVMLNGKVIEVTLRPQAIPIADPHAGLYLCGQGNVGRLDVFVG